MYILSLICCFVKDQLMKFRKQENKSLYKDCFSAQGETLHWFGVCVGGGVYGENLTRTCSSGGKDYVTTPVWISYISKTKKDNRNAYICMFIKIQNTSQLSRWFSNKDVT